MFVLCVAFVLEQTVVQCLLAFVTWNLEFLVPPVTDVVAS